VNAPAAPRFPGLSGYSDLAAGLHELGLRHLADLVAAETAPLGAETDATGRARFRVVDGFLLAQPGGRWLRVDRDTVREAHVGLTRRFPQSSPRGAALLSLLDAALDDDPGVLRQALLYQLIAAAEVGAGDGRAATVAQLLDLGVHSAEADGVLHLVQTAVPLDAAAAEAAEQLADVARRQQFRRARVLVSRIPPEHGDWRLTRLCAEVERRTAEADQLLDEAIRCERAGALDDGVDAYLRVARLTADDMRVRAGLLRLAIRRADHASASEQTSRLRLASVDDGVRITCRLTAADAMASPGFSSTILRIDGDDTDGVALFEGAGGSHLLTDSGVAFGQTVRYAVVPTRGGMICGAVQASPRIRYAPDIEPNAVRYRPQGVGLSWRRPRRAVAIRVLRSNAGGVPTGAGTPPPGTEVACRADGLDDPGVEPGLHEYLVRCGYPAPDGSPALVWSEGRTVAADVKPWPSPVRALEVEAIGPEASVRVHWDAPDLGTDRLVLWPFGHRDPGSDVSGLLSHVPGSLMRLGGSGGRRSAEAVGRPGDTMRVMAVSVLGDRAVAGPSALVQVLGAPRGLRAGRVPGSLDTALVDFCWPDPAVLVALSWEQDGLLRRAHIARSRFPAGGIPIAVGRSACRVTVEPLGRPDADLVFSGAAVAMLPEVPAVPLPPRCQPPQCQPPVRRRRWFTPWTWFRRRPRRRRWRAPWTRFRRPGP
jgi:hypothetical protein